MAQLKILMALCVVALTAGCAALETKNKLVYLGVSKPVWLAGVENERLTYTQGYPKAVATDRFKVVNAGWWMYSDKGAKLNLAYEYSLNVIQPFAEQVHLKMTLDNPADPDSPFIYQSTLSPQSKSTVVRHSPVSNLELGAQYRVRLEVFSDADLQNRIDQVEQVLISPIGNTADCIAFSEAYREQNLPKGVSNLLGSMTASCHL
ncbi:MAG: hypothetical protein M0Q98_10030 [Pseudomonas sp.]|nr:hypothetical protein [Pseudomonas sp.]MDD2223006.1 hypothetical protein [Pseudomonas sp.]MDY0414988.1 hypothetical protein [Pseudomonas sp.]NLO53210.1 hypothetical protein [Gammaproteobacteria bacterium]